MPYTEHTRSRLRTRNWALTSGAWDKMQLFEFCSFRLKYMAVGAGAGL